MSAASEGTAAARRENGPGTRLAGKGLVAGHRSAKPTSAKRLFGQYFTPRDAARFVLEAAARVLGAKPRRILDPACGDGAFLAGAIELGLVEPRGAFGMDIDAHHLHAARRLGLDGNVRRADALAGDLPGPIERARAAGFDLVVGNPPFGGGGGDGRLEERFALRFASLARPGGAGGVILPTGVFANAASRRLRDDLLSLVDPVAVVELPRDTFRRAGASARTSALFFKRRRGRGRARPCLFVRCDDSAPPAEHYDRTLRAVSGGPLPAGALRVPIAGLAEGRWDPGFVCHEAGSMLESCRLPLARLGDFVEHMTYGPILTGARTRRAEPGPVRVVGLRELKATGLDLRGAMRVREGGERDLPRCRLRRGDIVLARSGAGSLLRGRLAVFGGPCPATVACFVDLVRLRGIRPGYAAICLRSRVARAQVERLANGVGTPNISFGEIRGLLVPRAGEALEAELAREEAAARREHSCALSRGREPAAAARRLEVAVARLERAAFGQA